MVEAESDELAELLQRSTAQANLGNWELAAADAITAREIDPQSGDAWKLCARVSLASGDAKAALECLHEAMHIDMNDGSACAILQKILDDHLYKQLEVRFYL